MKKKIERFIVKKIGLLLEFFKSNCGGVFPIFTTVILVNLKEIGVYWNYFFATDLSEAATARNWKKKVKNWKIFESCFWDKHNGVSLSFQCVFVFLDFKNPFRTCSRSFNCWSFIYALKSQVISHKYFLEVVASALPGEPIAQYLNKGNSRCSK